ncbi:MAG TPA: hypothetical protein VLE72_03375 [Candidatus Saccharimonadales bacterium]|nr:hypothetical protein [Candidatus Saccharimonadales bacterium]
MFVSTLTTVTDEVLAEIAAEKVLRRTSEVFLIFGMGSQFDHLILQAISALGVFAIVADPASVTADDVKLVDPIGIILSGGPASAVTDPPPFDQQIFDLGIPILGICLGFQMWAQHIGAHIVPGHEYGQHILMRIGECVLLEGLPDASMVLESHGECVLPGSTAITHAETTKAAVAVASAGHLWGVQFHPEVPDTDYGQRIFENFCFKISGAKDVFPAEDVAAVKVAELKREIGTGKVLLALSGGSDSAVAGYLLKAAVPGQIKGVYIKGVDRPDDEAHVLDFFGHQPWLELEIIDAKDLFVVALAGIEGMPDKRVAVRGVYKEVLETAARAYGANFIAQGTLYTDLSESGLGHTSGVAKAQIKQHHNTNLDFYLPELIPLADQVKDTARNIGRQLGVPKALLTRHPFPGPGLVVRIEGEITAEKLAMARQSDAIFISELHATGLYQEVWQAGTVVTQSITTTTKGDGSGSGPVLALWAVTSTKGFTARAAELPWDFMRAVMKRIINEVVGVGSVVYRISDKPPSTIEWG